MLPASGRTLRSDLALMIWISGKILNVIRLYR